MNEEYLWDKTGEDAEIEQLENMLAAFRYQEIAPPALPAKILPFPPKSAENISSGITLRRRSKVFAFAACAAAILIAFGILLQLQFSNTAIVTDSAKISMPQVNNDIRENSDASVASPESSATQQSQIMPRFEELKKPSAKHPAKRTVKQNAVTTRRIIPKVSLKTEIIAVNAKVENPNAALTREEKNAYDQLMLALSITGSKLKIVRDKIDRTEEKNNVVTDGR